MDYCSSCRRTLNGALVCPGCGAYAPDIAPPGHQSQDSAPAAVTTSEAWRGRGFPVAADYFGPTSRLGAEPTAHSEIPEYPATGAGSDVGAGVGAMDSSDDEPADDSEYAASAVPVASAVSAVPATEGRAARRRELARWKKQRRRAVVASTVALVGGGLTLAVLPSRPSTGHDAQASAAPEPHAVATTLGDATDTGSSTVLPRTDDPQDSTTPTQPPAISSPPRNATTVVTTTATKALRLTSVAARPTATTSPQARTVPVTSVTDTNDEAPATADPTPPPQQTTT
ncbi:SCO2400 family protein, partial [Streptomyces odonnellii]